MKLSQYWPSFGRQQRVAKSVTRDRARRITFTALASLCLRCTTTLSNFIAVPLTLHYLGKEEYGYWVAMSSMVAMLSFANGGVGYELMNKVGEAAARADNEAVRRAISNSCLVLLALAVTVFLACLFVRPYVPWTAVFHSNDPGIADKCSTALLVMAGTFLFQLPLQTVQRVQFALQEGFASEVWQIVGVLLGLVGLVLATRIHSNLPVLALAYTGGPFLGVAFNWLTQFVVRRPQYRPHIKDLEWKHVRYVVTHSSYFLILQVGWTFFFAVDNIIIIHRFGPIQVTEYNLVSRLFQIGQTVAMMWFAPLWPAYVDAIARHDMVWVKKTLKRSLVSSGSICTVFSIAMFFSYTFLVHIWIHTTVHPSRSLLVAIAVNTVLLVVNSGVSTYLSASNYIKGQAGFLTLQLILALILKVILANHLGTAGVIWASVIAYLTVGLPAYLFVIPRLIRQQKERARRAPSTEVLQSLANEEIVGA
jgi:O-antigen/teichoic acid export membrane protein